MKKILVIHGPNLNLLGEREPEIYGSLSLRDLNAEIEKFAVEMNLQTKFYQSNHEGALLDFLHEHRKWADGLLVNPGALTHYSYTLRDAVAAVNLPAVEVHLSDIQQREEFRKKSVIKDVCLKQISGLGLKGYLHGIEYLVGFASTQILQSLISKKVDIDHLLTEFVGLLKNNFPKYTWVGIYLLEGDGLVLHNFLGKPTPHTTIPVGQGICGAAVREKDTIIVADVNADSRYLACSLETRSEIVVPIMSDDRIWGEIDIDSDFADIFHEGDKEFLENCAALLAHGFVSASD